MLNAKIVDLGTLGYYMNLLRGISAKFTNKKISKNTLALIIFFPSNEDIGIIIKAYK